jgi:hypothetical protein
MSEEPQQIEGEDGADAVDEGADDAPQLPSVEELAAELGWKPKDQWTGPEAEWRDPVTYIKYGQNATLVQQVKELKKSHETLVRTTAATTKRLLDEQAAEINARWEQAIEDGDKDGARRAERDMRAVEAQRNAPDPLVADFQERNDWYGVDPEATDYAAAVSARLAQQGKSVAEQLEAAEKSVRKRFPELFEGAAPAPKPRQAPQVHAPASRSALPQKRGKSAADLPRDVRAAGEDFVRMATSRGMKYTIDDYAKTYFAEQGIAA